MKQENHRNPVIQGKKVFVGKSSIHNLGIIAKRLIKKGETVFIVKGKKVFFEIKHQKHSLHGPNWVGIGKNTWIDPIGFSRYLNHSCNPSAGIKGSVTVVALKDIKKGEEVSIDYSITEGDKFWYMNCRCGSKDCLGRVRSVQFLPEKKYKKYLPYIPRYFQRCYLIEHLAKK